MPVRSCRVTIQDMDGVSHTVEVTAATLYEAVAQGLAAIRGNDWVAGIAQGLNAVKVSVADVRVEHEVKLMDFTKWVDRTGASPREADAYVGGLDSGPVREKEVAEGDSVGDAEELLRIFVAAFDALFEGR